MNKKKLNRNNTSNNTIPLKNRDTYIYIDASNIRAACYKTLGFRIDFAKMIDYFKRKYPNLKEIRYYEGIAKGDQKKRRMFDFLERQGYIICPLERKTYNSIEITKQGMKYPKCGHKWTAEIAREHRTMKSNVDVYLASNMVKEASRANHPIRIILISCDGDYAEAIKDILEINKNIAIVVLATPYTTDIAKNTCSVRLKSLVKEIGKPRFVLNNIDNIRPFIESA